ncbi:protein kinase [Thiotrichales bacterium 19S3-7]|nr:protein kinase [Thiotrichales bacterium 19S3-7]MCF6801500.1 protein kinase [Thiotrichales bacterium 19S3-11]
MGIIKVSDEEWKAINILLKDKPEGTTLKHRYRRYVSPLGMKKIQQEYHYQDEGSQQKKIKFDHSFIVADGKIWAIPNESEKANALLGHGMYGKVVIRENQQDEQSLHKVEYKSNRTKSRKELELSKREQKIALDVGLAYTSVTKSYFGEMGKRVGDHIMVMPYKDNPKDIAKKYEKVTPPITTMIKALEQLKNLHSGELSKTNTQYLHRDLKLANIIEDDKGVVTIIDYGFAIEQSEVDKQYVGTPLTMAPEFFQAGGPEYSTSSDLFALVKSILLHEIEVKFPAEYQRITKMGAHLPLAYQLSLVNQEINKFLIDNHTTYQSDLRFYLSNQVLIDVVIKPKEQRPTTEEVIKALELQQQKIAEIEEQKQIQLEQQRKALQEKRKTISSLKELQDRKDSFPIHPGRVFLQQQKKGVTPPEAISALEVVVDDEPANSSLIVNESLTDSDKAIFHSIEVEQEVDDINQSKLDKSVKDTVLLQMAKSTPSTLLDKSLFFMIESKNSNNEGSLVADTMYLAEKNMRIIEKLLNFSENKASGYVGYGGQTVNYNSKVYYYVPTHVAATIQQITEDKINMACDCFIQFLVDELSKANASTIGWTSYAVGGRHPEIDKLYSNPAKYLNEFKAEVETVKPVPSVNVLAI